MLAFTDKTLRIPEPMFRISSLIHTVIGIVV